MGMNKGVPKSRLTNFLRKKAIGNTKRTKNLNTRLRLTAPTHDRYSD